MSGDKPKAARLPKDAPPILRDFVACKIDKIELDSKKLDWLPNGPLGEFGPSVGIKPGSAPNTGTITYGIIELPASIGADGQLEVDSSGFEDAGPLDVLHEGIQNWVNAFNGTMKANEKGLKGLTITGSKMSLAKGPLGPPPLIEMPGGGTPATPPPKPPTPPTPPVKPVTPPPTKGFFDWLGDKWKELFGLLIFVFGAFGLVSVFGGDDEQTTVDDSSDLISVQDDGDDSESDDSGSSDTGSSDTASDDSTARSSFDFGHLPVLPGGGIFDVTVEPGPGCDSVGSPGTITITPYASGRGMAASVSGMLDGTLYMGAGELMFEGRTAHITRDDVPSADTDNFDITLGPDGFMGPWEHRVLDGEDAATVGPGMGTCDVGGLLTLTSPDFPALSDAINGAPALDLDVGQIEDVTCESTPTGIVLGGFLSGAAPGDMISGQAGISADEYIDLGMNFGSVGPDGRLAIDFDYDGNGTHVSATFQQGVYSVGGAFIEDCD